MSNSSTRLLPFEFARNNGLLVREVEGDLVLSPGVSQWAIAEVQSHQWWVFSNKSRR